ncbi:MAG: hypothetical protein NW218_14760 [Saprospiraceae bacterium]|nr:hypothetical protein [Saprospiraceae bacterium]
MKNKKNTELKKLIASGDVSKVIDDLLKYFEETKSTSGVSDFEKEIIISSYRYSENEKQRNLGVLKDEIYQETKTKIIVALIELIGNVYPDIEDEKIGETSTTSAQASEINKENSGETPPETMVKTNPIEEMIESLNRVGHEVKSHMNEEEADEILDALAFFVGQKVHMKKVKELITEIRRTNAGQTIQINLTNSVGEIDSVTNIANRLDNYLMATKNYANKKLSIAANQRGKSFFNDWENRYIVAAVKNIVTTTLSEIDFKYIRRPNLLYMNKQYPSDLIFSIDDQFYVIKANSRTLENPGKLKELAFHLRISDNNIFLLLADTNQEQIKAIKVLHKINAYNIGNFIPALKEVIVQNHFNKLKPESSIE